MCAILCLLIYGTWTNCCSLFRPSSCPIEKNVLRFGRLDKTIISLPFIVSAVGRICWSRCRQIPMDQKKSIWIFFFFCRDFFCSAVDLWILFLRHFACLQIYTHAKCKSLNQIFFLIFLLTDWFWLAINRLASSSTRHTRVTHRSDFPCTASSSNFYSILFLVRFCWNIKYNKSPISLGVTSAYRNLMFIYSYSRCPESMDARRPIKLHCITPLGMLDVCAVCSYPPLNNQLYYSRVSPVFIFGSEKEMCEMFCIRSGGNEISCLFWMVRLGRI